MRYMIMVRATADTEAGRVPPDVGQLMADMTAFNDELARAGALLDAAGLKPSATGFRIEWDGDGSRVLDGPFAESKELVAGYTLIQVRDREEALAWARRFPNPMGKGRPAVIEVRPLYEAEEVEALVAQGAEPARVSA
jgi:hypothetical protein